MHTEPLEADSFTELDTSMRLSDIEKRLYQIENILLGLTSVIDMAREYDDRLVIIEKLILRRVDMAVKGMKTDKVKMNAMKKVKDKKPAKQKAKMPKKAGYQKAGSKKEYR